MQLHADVTVDARRRGRRRIARSPDRASPALSGAGRSRVRAVRAARHQASSAGGRVDVPRPGDDEARSSTANSQENPGLRRLPPHRAETRACPLVEPTWLRLGTKGTRGPVDRRGAGPPAERRADPAAQPRGRGVAARVDAAVARRDHRGRRGPGRLATTSTSRRTATSSKRVWSLYEQGEPVDPVTVAEELRRGRAARGARGQGHAAADPGRDARVGERGPLRQDRERARAAPPPHHVSRARSPSPRTTSPTT